jgi:hypothetical protein
MALVLLPLLTVAYAATLKFLRLRLPPAEVDAMQAHEAKMLRRYVNLQLEKPA